MTIELRKAEMGDADMLLRWRNDRETRKNSLRTGIVAYSDHMAWMEWALDDDLTEIFIGVHDEAPVGVIRFDNPVQHGTVEVSITIAPECRGKGYGRKLLSVGGLYKRDDHLLAIIKKENKQSIKMFERAGYTYVRPGEQSNTILRETSIYVRPPLLV